MTSEDLPNGFLGFNQRRPGFESAGDALRRSRADRDALNVDTASRGFRNTEYQAAKSGWQVPNTVKPEQNPGPEKSLWGKSNDFFPADMRKYLTIPEGGASGPEFNYEELAQIPEVDKRWSWVS